MSLLSILNERVSRGDGLVAECNENTNSSVTGSLPAFAYVTRLSDSANFVQYSPNIVALGDPPVQSFAVVQAFGKRGASNTEHPFYGQDSTNFALQDGSAMDIARMGSDDLGETFWATHFTRIWMTVKLWFVMPVDADIKNVLSIWWIDSPASGARELVWCLKDALADWVQEGPGNLTPILVGPAIRTQHMSRITLDSYPSWMEFGPFDAGHSLVEHGYSALEASSLIEVFQASQRSA